MGYSTVAERQQYQHCDNCIFNKACFLQEIQREQEKAKLGNDCLIYQDERDIAPALRTELYEAVKDLPEYEIRMRKPLPANKSW